MVTAFRTNTATGRALTLGLLTAAAGFADPDGPPGEAALWDPAPLRVSVFAAIRDHQERSTVTFREASVNFPGSHLRADSAAYSVEASIAPQFTLLRATLEGPAPGAYMLTVTPKFVVRRSDGIPSNPVRTPGYMPSVTLYYSPFGAEDDTPQNLWYLSLTAMHHSNGQSGELLNPDGQTVNKVDGSFSLWSAAVAVHVDADWPFLPAYKMLQLERLYNKEGVLDALYPDYVATLRMQTRARRHGGGAFAGQSYLLFDLGWRFRKSSGMPNALKPAPFSMEMTGIYAPDWGRKSGRASIFPDLAVFGRFYSGADYYNVNFNRDIRRVDLGLMFGSWIGLADDARP